MKDITRSSLVVLFFVVALLVVGFFNFNGFEKTVKPLSELSLNDSSQINFPYDIRRFPNTVLSCKNTGKTAKKLSLTVINGEGGAAQDFNIKKGATVNKNLKALFSKLGIKVKEGVLVIEKDDTVECSLKKIGDIIIAEEDISSGTIYLQDTPALINSNLKRVSSNNLIIYNTNLEDGKFKIKSYLEDGSLDSEEEVTVKALSSYALEAKNNKSKSYHVTSETEGGRYLAFVRAKIAGKFYISKPLRTFESSIFSPNGGVLIASNITSAPATFHYYVVSKDGKKKYQGMEWVLPYGQRKIALDKLSKLKGAKMEIVPISYYYPRVCNDKGECFSDESKGDATLVMSYQRVKTVSPSVIERTEEQLSDEVRYTQNVAAKLDVSCNIDKVVKPYCGKDSNSNGVDDAEELFHYFADPELEDADQDGFSNAEEIAAGTKAFHPFDFPGVPKDDTIDGMYELARTIEAYIDSKKTVEGDEAKGMLNFDKILKGGSSRYLSYNNIEKASVRRSDSQIEALYDSINSFHPLKLHGYLLRKACEGLNICIEESKYSDEIATHVDGCLNVMNQVVGSIVGKGCRYCNAKITIAPKDQKDENLKCNELITADDSTSRSTHSEWGIDINPRDLEGRSQHVICHELGHAFYGADDRYAEEDFNIPSLYSRPPFITDCLTSYDVYILELATIRQMTGKPLSEIIRMTRPCTEKGKHGFKIGEYGECLEDWTADGYKDNPRLYCPPDGQQKEENPDIKHPYEKVCHCHEIEKNDVKYCCENEDDIICGGDCCSREDCDETHDVCLKHRCGQFEDDVTVTIEVLGREIQKCCPRIQTIYGSDGKAIDCCYGSERAVGDECCAGWSFLETAEGLRCCPEEMEFACPDAIGSVDGCCKKGCLQDSDHANRICACEDDEYRVDIPMPGSYYSYYGGCCKKSQYFFSDGQNSVKCVDECPDNMEAKKRECACKKEHQCGNLCCKVDENCQKIIFNNTNKYECKQCPTGTKGNGEDCICIDTGEKHCDGKCCKKDEVCKPWAKGGCIECPDGSDKKDYKTCICKNTGYETCGPSCCGRNQICDTSELKCIDCKAGETACDTKCCGKGEICAGAGECRKEVSYDDCKMLNECVLAGCDSTKVDDCLGMAFSSLDCVDQSRYNVANCIEQAGPEGDPIVCCPQS